MIRLRFLMELDGVSIGGLAPQLVHEMNSQLRHILLPLLAPPGDFHLIYMSSPLRLPTQAKNARGDDLLPTSGSANYKYDTLDKYRG